jgi:AcrR family transcriptional regulator
VPPKNLTRQPRDPLTRERIFAAAVELADTEGLKSLSMRRLGHSLGVEAMSLYNHIQDKDDLLAGIVGSVLGEVVFSPPSLDWRRSLRDSAISAHDALLRHPWAGELLLSPGGPGATPARLRHIEMILERLRFAGLSPSAASRGYHAIDSHVLGFTLWELGHRLPDDAPPDFLETMMRAIDLDAYPYLIEHAGVHMSEDDES